MRHGENHVRLQALHNVTVPVNKQIPFTEAGNGKNHALKKSLLFIFIYLFILFINLHMYVDKQ